MPSKKKLKIIIVDRGTELFNRIRNIFVKTGAQVFLERTMEHAFEKFEEQTFDILMLSAAASKYEAGNEFDVLEVISEKCPVTQIIVIADPKELSPAFSALKAGSYHYVKLPVSDNELSLIVETAIERRPRFGSNLLLKNEAGKTTFEEMVGSSQPMRDVYRQIRQAAMTDIPVLITGETGTGKDLVARAIHQIGMRKHKRYIPIHLGALPQELVSGELFGYEKGAFTGAWKRYIGSFEKAHGGTIFLDEVGSIDEKNQVSLLRLLETKKFSRIGGGKEIRSNVRIIAATNEDLAESVRLKRFREDLFYRLDVFRIHLPPVRSRQGDVALLLNSFLKRFSNAYQKDILGISPECINRLESYDWPGNVREIRNIIHRSVVMCSGEVLLSEHLPKKLLSDSPSQPEIRIRIGTTLQETEKQLIEQTLRWANNNRSRTAKILGLSRPALYNKIERYGL